MINKPQMKESRKTTKEIDALLTKCEVSYGHLDLDGDLTYKPFTSTQGVTIISNDLRTRNHMYRKRKERSDKSTQNVHNKE